MNGRRAVVGLCMLCALLVSGFAAQSAGAVGTTAYTCKEGAPGAPHEGAQTFNTAHCRPTDGAGSFRHHTIPNNTTTQLTIANKDHTGAKLPFALYATVFGTTIELEAKTVEGSGSMTNSEEGGEMIASGEGTTTYREVSVVKPAKCSIQTDVLPSKEKGEVGVMHTEPIKVTTKGQGDRLKFEPKEGNVFTRFWMEGAECPLKATTFTVTGSVTATLSGATSVFTEADTTAQNTLKLNGAKAGIAGQTTGEAKHPGIVGDAYKPLSVTTS